MSEESCFICLLLNNTVRATHQITDARDYPAKYNGKWLCDDHWKDREYMKQVDVGYYIRREDGQNGS